MLKRIKGWVDEGKERQQQRREEKEQQRQELERLQRLGAQREAERLQQKRELQRKVVAILGDGKVPDLGLDVSVPFKLQKNEKWLLSVGNVAYAEMRVKREVVGRSAGASVRVAKGVSVRMGASKGTPVESDVLTPRGRGQFALSTKHIFFQGERSFRIPLNKVVSAQSIPGKGLEVVRDRASALPEYFGIGGEDADFVATLIHLLPDVDFGRGEPAMQPVESYILLPGDVGGDGLLHEDEE